MSGQKRSEPIVNKCYGDKMETSECRLKGSETRAVVVIAWSHFRAGVFGSQWTGFPRARGKMMKNKANGPLDCLVTEMLQCLPMETVYAVTHWFEKGVQRRMSGSRGAENSSPCVSQAARRQARQRAKRLSRDRTAECVLKVV